MQSVSLVPPPSWCTLHHRYAVLGPLSPLVDQEVLLASTPWAQLMTTVQLPSSTGAMTDASSKQVVTVANIALCT